MKPGKNRISAAAPGPAARSSRPLRIVIGVAIAYLAGHFGVNFLLNQIAGRGPNRQIAAEAGQVHSAALGSVLVKVPTPEGTILLKETPPSLPAMKVRLAFADPRGKDSGSIFAFAEPEMFGDMEISGNRFAPVRSFLKTMLGHVTLEESAEEYNTQMRQSTGVSRSFTAVSVAEDTDDCFTLLTTGTAARGKVRVRTLTAESFFLAGGRVACLAVTTLAEKGTPADPVPLTTAWRRSVQAANP